jgi:hypothetical protein
MTSSRPTFLRRLVLWLSIAIVATVVLYVSPGTAMAAPGDASAVGLLAGVNVEVVAGPTVAIDDRIGFARLSSPATRRKADSLGTWRVERC